MSLSDVRGHDRPIHILMGAAALGRVASSYLFEGESGVGKRLTAFNFVKALNCEDPVPVEGGKGHTDACDACQSCHKYDSGAHPDFTIVEPEDGQIKVDTIRALEGTLNLKPFEAAMKAVIIDEADRMNEAAANAFLKTLEEPPHGSLIILVSSSPDRLPDTIRSRCLRVGFTSLSEEEAASVIADATGDREKAAVLARLSMGRPGLAIGGEVLARRESFFSALDEMLSGQMKTTWEGKADIEDWLDFSFILLRDMAALKAAGKDAALVNEDMRKDIEKMSAKTSLEGIIDYYDRLSTLRVYTGFNLNKSITWNYTGSLVRGLMRPAGAGR